MLCVILDDNSIWWRESKVRLAPYYKLRIYLVKKVCEDDILMIKRRITIVTAIGLLLWAMPGWSYILKLDTILSRTAQNHGKGFYKIEQDVVFPHEKGNQVVREIWTIGGNKKMHLEAVGREDLKDKLHIHFAYQSNKKYQMGRSGTVISSPLSPDWVEFYFHFRETRSIKQALLKQKILPQETTEPVVRLSRVGGMVAYGIHHANPHSTPGIWIQQDQFHVQRLRFLSQAQVSASQYKSFARQFWFPSHRKITWDEHSVEIKLIRVIALSKNQKVHRQLNPARLSNRGYTPIENELIRDFYHRFR